MRWQRFLGHLAGNAGLGFFTVAEKSVGTELDTGVLASKTPRQRRVFMAWLLSFLSAGPPGRNVLGVNFKGYSTI